MWHAQYQCHFCIPRGFLDSPSLVEILVADPDLDVVDDAGLGHDAEPNPGDGQAVAKVDLTIEGFLMYSYVLILLACWIG